MICHVLPRPPGDCRKALGMRGCRVFITKARHPRVICLLPAALISMQHKRGVCRGPVHVSFLYVFLEIHADHTDLAVASSQTRAMRAYHKIIPIVARFHGQRFPLSKFDRAPKEHGRMGPRLARGVIFYQLQADLKLSRPGWVISF